MSTSSSPEIQCPADTGVSFRDAVIIITTTAVFGEPSQRSCPAGGVKALQQLETNSGCRSKYSLVFIDLQCFAHLSALQCSSCCKAHGRGGVSRSALASKAPAKQSGLCLAPEMLCKTCGGLVILSDLGVY